MVAKMNFLPRVSTDARELISREFDSRGPDVCVAEISEHLREHNPELLDMAKRCAADPKNGSKAMVGFTMLYRVLMVQSRLSGAQSPIPRVTEETRDRLVAEIDEIGEEAFTIRALGDLQESNPELLQMAHIFSSGLEDYLSAMQGFALLYKALLMQSMEGRHTLH
jgi:hypothetical protein